MKWSLLPWAQRKLKYRLKFFQRRVLPKLRVNSGSGEPQENGEDPEQAGNSEEQAENAEEQPDDAGDEPDWPEEEGGVEDEEDSGGA